MFEENDDEEQNVGCNALVLPITCLLGSSPPLQQ
jgi:hypothetical protein